MIVSAFTGKQIALEVLRQLVTPGCPPMANAGLFEPGRFDAGLLSHGLHELVSERPVDHAAALAFALAGAAWAAQTVGKPLLFLSFASEAQERGALHGAGLARLGIDPACMMTCAVAHEKDLLWAAEEGASCAALGAIVLTLASREKLYGFTASRRLKLRQEQSGVPVFVVRQQAGDATAATARWRIASASSEGERVIGASMPLLGAPRFHVRLERYAGLPPQDWEIECDASHGLRMAAPISDRPDRTERERRRSAA
jgi:protein ImuA